MGIVVDEARAETTPCYCYRIGPTDEPRDLLCWSPGIIGALTDEQEMLYCPEKTIVPPTERMSERLRRLKALMSCLSTDVDFIECVKREWMKYERGGG